MEKMFYIIRAYKDKSELLWAIRLERKTRLELATPTLARLCSTNWAISAECEEEETRTPTSQLTLPPQSSASTNSATSPFFLFLCFVVEWGELNHKLSCWISEILVPRTGLEPARRETLAPETSASTIPPPGLWKWFNLSKCERKTRLELATPTLARLCSTNWAISAFHYLLLPFSRTCSGVISQTQCKDRCFFWN